VGPQYGTSCHQSGAYNFQMTLRFLESVHPKPSNRWKIMVMGSSEGVDCI
jgi:hypothetical protein